MSAPDLFEQEAAALARAVQVRDSEGLGGQAYREALSDMIGHYERLMRETRRLIRRSDREERELNVVNGELQQLATQLEYKAKHDSMTGALNRGAIFERAALHLQQGPLALIVLDIDFFKRINDEYGHPAGDAVICEVVQCLCNTLQRSGEIGRVGGEEFSILLPNVSLDDALVQAERMRSGIGDQPFECLPQRLVTASFGVSWTDRLGNFGEAYGRADEALFDAKRAGRNQVKWAA